MYSELLVICVEHVGYEKKKKLSNKATLSLCLLSKCSFTLSKLRFFELRKPKISSCYTTSKTKEAVHKTEVTPKV